MTVMTARRASDTNVSRSPPSRGAKPMVPPVRALFKLPPPVNDSLCQARTPPTYPAASNCRKTSPIGSTPHASLQETYLATHDVLRSCSDCGSDVVASDLFLYAVCWCRSPLFISAVDTCHRPGRQSPFEWSGGLIFARKWEGGGTPRRRLGFFFLNGFISTHYPRGEFGRPLRMPDANPPPTGFGCPISRSDAPPCPGPLCHWAGEPAGRHSAESAS